MRKSRCRLATAMSEMIRPDRGVGLVATATSLALVVAACGGGTQAVDNTGTSQPAASASESDSTSAPADETTMADEPSAEANEGPSEEVGAEHLFPDSEVIRVADGSATSLAAELAGGDRPVLLWFWAPH